MSIEEFVPFYKRLLENHSMENNLLNTCFCPKYVNFYVDTRDNQVFCIIFKEIYGDYDEQFEQYIKTNTYFEDKNKTITIREPRLYESAMELLDYAEQCDKRRNK